MKPLRSEDCLEVAARIGRRLSDQAKWDGGSCTWEVKVPDHETRQRGRLITRDGGGLLYQGTAGIALFLGELRGVTGDRELDRVLRGAMRHALESGAELAPSAVGLHAGRTGIAYVAARLGKVLEEPRYLAAAGELLAPLAGNESSDSVFDVIGGGAGAIPALLQTAHLTGDELPIEIARALGDRLVEGAHREPEGWSWQTLEEGARRHLTGFAHGAAGIGLALLELAHATGEGRYRFAAEMAFLYERQHFDAATSNWPDFRCQSILDARYYGRLDDLVSELRAGRIAEPPPTFATAWCHGAPGIGLTRLRAFELCGQTAYREEVEAAIDATRRSVVRLEDNYSLCHGLAGNCELLIEAARRLPSPDPGWRAAVELCAAHGQRNFEGAGRPWPGGTIDREADPSLLLGEAGIGYFYLRLAAPRVPSILLLRPALAPASRVQADAGFAALAREYREAYFGDTRRAFRALGVAEPRAPAASRDASPRDRSPALEEYRRLRRTVELASGRLRELLEDAFRRDRARFELSLELDDYTAEYLGGLIRRPVAELDWRAARLSLAPGARVVRTRWDWPGWLAAGDGARPAEPPQCDRADLLHRRSNRIRVQPLGELAAIVLEALQEPAGLAEVAARVGELVAADGPRGRAKLLETVRRQLAELYRAGFIEAPAAPLTAAPEARREPRALRSSP